MTSHERPRVVSNDLRTQLLDPGETPTPLATASRVIARIPSGEIGLWEAGPGTDTDVEEDEVFLVLDGAGSVTFSDGSAIDLKPGVVVRLYEGDRTTWVITERIRKLYLT